MYLSPEQIAARLGNENNLTVKHNGKGSGRGAAKNRTNDERALLAGLAKVTTQDTVSSLFNANQGAISKYSRGIVSETKGVNPLLQEKVQIAEDVTVKDVTERALNGLVKALGVVDDRVGSVKDPREASAIAKDMAIVVDRFTPKEREASFNGVNIIIHAPRQRDEEDFDFIDV